MDIKLGSSLSQVKKTYPPVKPWTKTREPNGQVTRIQFERYDCKSFATGVDHISLEMLEGKVIAVKAVFDVYQTRKESLTSLALRLSSQYGEPQRVGMTYRWQDGRTQLRVFDESMPLTTGKGVELRTAIEIVDESTYKNLHQ